jgi:hypothetical protein
MITVNKHLTAPVSPVALGLVLAAPASPSFAQRSENHMSAARAAAIHECNLRAARYRQYTWGDTEIHTYRACMSEHGQQE